MIPQSRRDTRTYIYSILFKCRLRCRMLCCAVLYCINAYARWYFFACFFFKYKLCFSYPKFKYRSERCIGKSYNSIRRTVLYNQNGTWNEMKWHRKRALEGIEEKLINWIIRCFLWLCVWKLFLKFPLLNWFSPVPALQYAIILIPQATFSHQVNDSTRDWKCISGSGSLTDFDWDLKGKSKPSGDILFTVSKVSLQLLIQSKSQQIG